MRTMGASRTLVITAALMLATYVAACADDYASEPTQESPDESGPPEPEEEEEAPEADRE